MKKISWIVVVCSFIAACKKEKVQMNEENFFLVGESKVVYVNLQSIVFAPDPILIPFIINIDHNFNFILKDNEENAIAKGVIKKCILMNKEIKYAVDPNKDVLNRYNVTANNYYYYVITDCIKSKNNLYKEFIRNINNIQFQIIPIKKVNPLTGNKQIIDYNYLLTFTSVDIIHYENKNHVRYEAYF